jgi:DNA polymerase III delta prime subunit
MEEYLWVEKYRPRTVDDTILPDDVKDRFKQFVQDKNVPNLLLTGPPGTGKTTIARAMLEEIGADYIIINGSLNRSIDLLRNDVQRFASSMSLTGGRKYVIVDEADGLVANHIQPAFRNFIEEYSKNCGFIFTCNFPNKIIEPLRSRLSQVDFKIKKSDKPALSLKFLKRMCSILQDENIEFDKTVVGELIVKYYPDWRRVLNELQQYSATGKIDSGILANFSETTLKTLMGFLKEKKFTDVRKWASENVDVDSASLFRDLYDTASQYLNKNSIPMLVLILGKYQFYDGQVADKEINIVACLTEIMLECDFL